MLINPYTGNNITVQDAFHDLTTRLYKITTGRYLDEKGDDDWGKQYSYPTYEDNVRSIIDYFTGLTPADVISHIENVFSDIEAIRTAKADLLSDCPLDKVSTEQKLEEELTFYIEKLTPIYNKLSNSFKATGEKIKVNLTGAQIAALFKLLIEEGIIEDIPKTAIVRFINRSFTQAKPLKKDNQEDWSSDYLYKLLKPESIEGEDYWDTKFVDLRNRISKKNKKK